MKEPLLLLPLPHFVEEAFPRCVMDLQLNVIAVFLGETVRLPLRLLGLPLRPLGLLLRKGRGCDEFQGVVAPSCDTDPGAQSELVLDAFDDVHGGDISEVASAMTPEDSRGVVISPSASDILIFLQIKPRPRDKPGSSLALVPYRLNYREEIPCDPVEAINGGELVGASLQALEEMVSDFEYLFVVQSRIRFLFYFWN